VLGIDPNSGRASSPRQRAVDRRASEVVKQTGIRPE
jgi:hypothetical protein